MKFLIQLLLVVLLTYLLQLFLPWWIIFVSAGTAGIIIGNKGFSAFAAGFLGVGLLWFAQAYFIDQANESILSAKVAELFTLSSSIQLILATALLGAICGGFGALTGYFLGGVFKKDKKQRSVYH